MKKKKKDKTQDYRVEIFTNACKNNGIDLTVKAKQRPVKVKNTSGKTVVLDAWVKPKKNV